MSRPIRRTTTLNAVALARRARTIARHFIALDAAIGAYSERRAQLPARLQPVLNEFQEHLQVHGATPADALAWLETALARTPARRVA